MKKRERKLGQWEYLEALGILENGTEEEIKNAKRTYRKLYQRAYKQKQRQENREFPVLLSRTNGDYGTVAVAAKRHAMTITAFLHAAVMGYLTQTYVVPNTDQVAALEQLLQSSLNEIKRITFTKERYHHERHEKYQEIEKRIIHLQQQIADLFRRPPSLEDLIRSAVTKNPLLKEKLAHLLTHDRQD